MAEDNKDKVDHSKMKNEYGLAGEAFFFFTIIYSHFLCYYMYYCLYQNDGALSFPSSIAQTPEWAKTILVSLYHDTFPTWYAAGIYFGYIFIETLLGFVMPGVWVKGLKVPQEKNIQYSYLCNGLSAWWASLAIVFVLHFSGLWRLNELARNYGPVMTVSVIFGNTVSFVVYFAAKLQNKVSRETGYFFHDFFMGIYMNPRIKYFDLKMWAEIRVSWTLLFFLTCSAAIEQYEVYQTVSPTMWVLIAAHFLYSNACQKGEECIPTTWDISYENWGWMLIFWNLSGVPFVYCFQSFFVLRHTKSLESYYSPVAIAVFFIVLIFLYYVWDTANAQKNYFRMMQRGTYVARPYAFPKLPWSTLKDPVYITTPTGSTLLCDGWWAFGRKIHYTADIGMALIWASSCGFTHALPFYYPAFFLTFLIHRELRDRAHLKRKYGDAYDEYLAKVPYAFIPGIY